MLQEKALALLKSGKNIFLTGSAGTGKTYILNQYINYLKDRKVAVATTASTGIAATHMNGMTIHAWSGIGVKEHLTGKQLASMRDKKYLRDHLEKTNVLIIDEISMLHKVQLNLVNEVLQFFRDNDKPFGGIQVVLCGDFFQLPPIGKPGERSSDKFAFMSQAWVVANFNIAYLTEQYRQDGGELNQILNEIRACQISKRSRELLQSAEKNQFEKEIEPTKLYTHNYDVDSINNEHLSKLKSKSKSYTAETKGNEKLVMTLKNSVLANEELELKIGAKVMFVKNNNEKGYVNGTMGTVIGFNEDNIPSVKLYDGRTVYAHHESWGVMDDKGSVLASFSQIPLRLAWAITIHKCQGMTLDAAEIDLSKTFERGQGYVGLSRLKKLDNLKLIGFNDLSLEVDSLAFKADLRFQELSAQADLQNTNAELDNAAISFLKKCGGLTNPDDIERNKKKIKEKKKGKKESTYDITLNYMRQAMSLKEIAHERGMTTGTVAGHLIRLKKENPDFNFSQYKPKKTICDKVEIAYKMQPKGEPISTKKLYEMLEGKVTYDDIKLALAFVV